MLEKMLEKSECGIFLVLIVILQHCKWVCSWYCK